MWLYLLCFVRRSVKQAQQLCKQAVSHKTFRFSERSCRVLDVPVLCVMCSPHSRVEKRKRSAASGWSTLRNFSASEHPPGAATPADLGSWPSCLASSLTGEEGTESEAALRLRVHLLRGVAVYTDYSGIECCREAMHLAIDGLRRVHGVQIREDACVFRRVSDKDSLALEVLMGLASHDDTCCVFGDIADRLPQFARDWIEAAMPLPVPSMSSAEIKDAYADIKNWILLHKENLFSDSAGSWCYKHKQVCPAHPLLSIGDDAKCLASSLQGVNRPLMVNVAGVSCTPWSSEGAQEQTASACEVPHSIWLAERIVRGSRNQEDIAFVECTPKYPMEDTLGRELGSTHHVVSMTFGPEHLGWPTKRLRVMGAAINMATCVWLGPGSPQEIAEDFAAKFFRSLQATGDIFCMSTEAELLEEYRFLAERQKNILSVEDIANMKHRELLRAVLPPGGVQRFDEWLQHGFEQGLESLGGSFFFDVDHHPIKGATGSPLMPVSLRHATMCRVNNFLPESWRVITAKEQLAAMGFIAFRR